MKRFTLLLLALAMICPSAALAVDVNVGPVHVHTVSKPTVVAYVDQNPKPEVLKQISDLQAQGYKVVVVQCTPRQAARIGELPYFKVFDKNGHYVGSVHGIIGLAIMLKVLKLVILHIP